MMSEQQFQAEVMDELKMLCYNTEKGSLCQEQCLALEKPQKNLENRSDGLDTFARLERLNA